MQIADYKSAGFIRNQMVQNAAVRLVLSQPKTAYLTPLFIPVCWLPVAACIKFKSLMYAYCKLTSYIVTVRHKISIQVLLLCGPLVTEWVTKFNSVTKIPFCLKKLLKDLSPLRALSAPNTLFLSGSFSSPPTRKSHLHATSCYFIHLQAWWHLDCRTEGLLKGFSLIYCGLDCTSFIHFLGIKEPN